MVVGAGYIGMELSTMLAKLGVNVTVVETLESVLPTYSADLSRPVKRRAESLGIEFRVGEAATGWEDVGNGIVVSTETEDGAVTTYEGDAVLVAVGCEPVTDTLNLDVLQVDPTDTGVLETDDCTRTDAEHILTVGDVTGESMLAHAASAEAEVAAGKDASLTRRAIPAAVFTDSEIATSASCKRRPASVVMTPSSGSSRSARAAER